MAQALTTAKTETKVVTTVQITGFHIDYEAATMTSSYMTLLEDGTPHQRGQVNIDGLEAIGEFMKKVEDGIRVDDKSIDEATTTVAYELVLNHLG